MENKWHGDLFTNGEKPNGKSPTGWFSGHHSRNSTIITTSGYKQGIPSTLPTYSSTLTPIPNWTCSVVKVSLSDARLPSMWLTVAQIPVRDFKTPIWKIIGCKVLQFIHTMKIRKMLGHKPYGANAQQFLQERERWTRSRTLSPIIICLNRVCSILVQLVYRLTALKTIILYV